MVGSKRYFGYFDDAGQERYMELDESNGETLDLGFGQAVTPAVYADYTKRIKVTSKFPIEPRYVLVERTQLDGINTSTRRLKLVVGSLAAPCWGATANTIELGGVEYAIRAKVGETRHLPPQKDNGQLDTDVDDNAIVTTP